MKRRLRWSSFALKDLLVIRNYIQRDNPQAAKSEADRIRKSVERLSAFPLSGRKLEVIPGIREVIAGNYHVYYRIVSSQVEILRVYHGKRKGLF